MVFLTSWWFVQYLFITVHPTLWEPEMQEMTSTCRGKWCHCCVKETVGLYQGSPSDLAVLVSLSVRSRTVIAIESKQEENHSTTDAASRMTTRSRIPGIGGRSASASLPSGLPQPSRHVSANDGHIAKVSSVFLAWDCGSHHMHPLVRVKCCEVVWGSDRSALELCSASFTCPWSHRQWSHRQWRLSSRFYSRLAPDT